MRFDCDCLARSASIARAVVAGLHPVLFFFSFSWVLDVVVFLLTGGGTVIPLLSVASRPMPGRVLLCRKYVLGQSRRYDYCSRVEGAVGLATAPACRSMLVVAAGIDGLVCCSVKSN